MLVAALLLCTAAAPPDGSAKVATAVQALNDAGMPRSATVLLAALATDDQQPEGVREAAKAQLASRAVNDPALAEMLLAQESDPGKLVPALALRLARGYLERALQLAPLEQDAGFGDSLRPSSEKVSPELYRARALAASVPAGDPWQGDALEVAGLASLAAGDDENAAKEFVALAQLPVNRGDAAASERRDKALLQLARLAYQSGDDAKATALYDRVSRGAPEWLDALFEASWSHFRKGEDEKALGNILTLQAPFFSQRFFPEAYVLKALVFYENCRYADARAALADFQQRYQPLHDGLSQTLASLTTPQAAAEFLTQGKLFVPDAAKGEVQRVAQSADVLGAAKAAVELAQEIDSLDKRPEVFRNSALITRVAPLARQARIALLESAGRKLIARLGQERAELRELLGQSLRLSYEIAGREKDLALNPEGGVAPVKRQDPPQVSDDEELWPFQGEYWRDELGSYRYQLGQRCKKPRPPPQTAQKPQPAPEKVAAP